MSAVNRLEQLRIAVFIRGVWVRASSEQRYRNANVDAYYRIVQRRVEEYMNRELLIIFVHTKECF